MIAIIAYPLAAAQTLWALIQDDGNDWLGEFAHLKAQYPDAEFRRYDDYQD